jgi:O-antigen/teichoic acid export membrane protein
MLSKLLRHASNYSAGSLLVTIASLVSFPLFTRIFSVDEYGLMNLVAAGLTFIVGLGKLGIQHSIVRMHGEVAAGRSEWMLANFYATVLWGMVGVGLTVTVLWALVCQFAPATWWNDERARGLLLFTAVLVVVRVVHNSLINVLRAEMRSGAFAIYQVVVRYFGLGAIVVTLFFISRSLYGFYAATIVTEVLVLAVLGVWLLRHQNVSPRGFSPTLFRAMAIFGAPMLGFEVARNVLNVADRYMIQAMMGGEALGLYSAAYNMSEYVQMIAIASIGQAIVPMYVRLWEEKGEAETRRFLEDSLRYYLLLGMPIIAGLSAVGEDLLVLLASEKYRAGAAIIPWVMAGIVIQGGMVIQGAGLYIHKHTVLIMARVAATAVLNIILNLVLIPLYGIVGAAIATLLSALALAALTVVLTRERLPLGVPWPSIVRYGLLSIAMYVIVTQAPFGHGAVGLVARVVTGALSYGLLVLAFDRKTSVAMFTAVRARLSGS